MKKVLIYSVAVAFLCVAGMATISAAGDDKGEAEYTLTTEAGKKPVVFPHAAHQERIECDKCHKDANFAPTVDGWTKDGGHALCKDCHKANGATTKCSGCHVKK